ANATGPERQKAKVVNLLVIEGEDQVMLKVTVAEVQRSALKQLGINLGAQITSGNLSLNLLTENALPLTAAQGLGTLPLAVVVLVGGSSTSCPAGELCLFNKGPGAANTSFGNSGAAGFYSPGSSTVAYAIRALERHGLVRTLAEPNLTAVSGE